MRHREINFLTSALLDSMRMGEISFDEMEQVRQLIEPGMARLAAQNRSDDDIEAMENAIALREGALKEGKIPVVVNVEFHQVIARASKNKMACLIIDAIASAFKEEFKRIGLTMKDHRSILRFHKAIAQAIRKQDGDGAFRLMLAHVTDVRPRLKTLKPKEGVAMSHG